MYLLDTDICSYLINHSDSGLHGRVRAAAPQELAVSAITLGETWFGLALKDVGLRKRRAAETFYAGIQVLDWPVSATPIYGRLRADLRKAGVDIGLNDVMIAAHAIAIDAILVTNNVGLFIRIGDPLRFENWLLP